MTAELPATVDLSKRAKLKLSGPDRVRYLNGQVTNDVTALDPKKNPGCYACVCTAKGKIEADVFITALDDDTLLIDADAALRDSLRDRLDKYIIADDVTLEDVSDDFILRHHLPYNPLHDSVASVDELSAQPVALSRATRFGPPGLDLYFARHAPNDTPPDLPDAVDPEFLEALRIAHGIPKWGAELTPGILPPEAGPEFIERAISYTKGCYIGQEVISRIKSVGRVNRQLVRLQQIPGASPPDAATLQPGLTLYTNNPEKPAAVGILTSCTSRHAREGLVALGYVKRDHLAPGTRLFAGDDANPLGYPLEISKSPLI